MTAIKTRVYEQKDITMNELLIALRNNFQGYEGLRKTLLNRTPKYGNDDDRADQVMVALFNAYFNAIEDAGIPGGVNTISTCCLQPYMCILAQ